MSMVWVQIELRNNTILRYIGFFIFPLLICGT
jgi:hypothetical protein